MRTSYELTCCHLQVPIVVTDWNEWLSTPVDIISPMHQAILTENSTATATDNVAIGPASKYGRLPIRMKSIAKEQCIAHTALDFGFWLIPQVWLAQFALLIGALEYLVARFAVEAVSCKRPCCHPYEEPQRSNMMACRVSRILAFAKQKKCGCVCGMRGIVRNLGAPESGIHMHIA